MDSQRTQIAKLNGKNFQIWKFKLELLLTKEVVWDVVENEVPLEKTADWLKKNRQAKSIMGLLLDDSLLISIKNLKYAREYWVTLKAMYEKSSLVSWTS